jgi:ADP-ribose pyrophosphatase
VSTRLIHSSRVGDWQAERVDLPGKEPFELEVLRHVGASAVVPFEDEDTVLLIRQYRHATGGTIWEVPAGKLDGDTPEVCAAKELEEEAGRRPGRLEHLVTIWTTPGFTDERIHLFAAFDLELVEQRLEEHEVIEVVPTSLERALEMVWAGEISDGKSALALLHAARSLGRLG